MEKMIAAEQNAGLARCRMANQPKISVEFSVKASRPLSGDRRMGWDRRRFDYTGHLPERRKRQRDRRRI